MATCDNPECAGRFTPKRSWQRFCSTRCRAFSRNQELKDRYTTPQAHSVLLAAMAWFDDDGTHSTELELWAACQRYRSALHQETDT